MAFHDMQVVCADCYAGYKAKHTRTGWTNVQPEEVDDSIDCDRHGPAKMAFVYQHLVHGSKIGFWHSDDG